MKIHHLIESQQFDSEFLLSLFDKADRIRESPESFRNSLNGKIMATLFYEPSTRTRLSFESAMLKLGGRIIGTENAEEFSSAIKGESLEDTARVISNYADCIVIRHKIEGSAKIASEVSPVPVINAGDGKGHHPTQALLDMYTIKREIGRIDNFTIAIAGDLSTGRTVRSLSYLLAKFNNIKIIFVSPEHLSMQEDIKFYLRKHGVIFREDSDLNSAMKEADIIYMTRIQKERMSIEDYQKAKGKFIINKENFHIIKNSARILHPLPHVEEINLPLEVEQTDPRVAYFRQAQNGLYVRMALLHELLTDEKNKIN